MTLHILANNSTNSSNNIFTYLLSFVVVFIVIGVIITACYFISNLIDRPKNKEEKVENISKPTIKRIKNTNITDDDMMAAVLVATIDFRNEIKEDVRLVDVREIK